MKKLFLFTSILLFICTPGIEANDPSVLEWKRVDIYLAGQGNVKAWPSRHSEIKTLAKRPEGKEFRDHVLLGCVVVAQNTERLFFFGSLEKAKSYAKTKNANAIYISSGVCETEDCIEGLGRHVMVDNEICERRLSEYLKAEEKVKTEKIFKRMLAELRQADLTLDVALLYALKHNIPVLIIEDAHSEGVMKNYRVYIQKVRQGLDKWPYCYVRARCIADRYGYNTEELEEAVRQNGYDPKKLEDALLRTGYDPRELKEAAKRAKGEAIPWPFRRK